MEIWFDNQAGAVDYVSSKKHKRVGHNFKKMSLDELKESYKMASLQIDNYDSLPKSVRGLHRDEVMSLVRYIQAIKIFTRKKFDVRLSCELHDEINRLKNEVVRLEQLYQAQKAKNSEVEEVEKTKRHEITMNRDSLVMKEFRKLVSNKIGQKECFELMKVAAHNVDNANN